MKVVSFNFKKISVEKFSDNFDKLTAGTNIDITDIAPLKQDLFKTKEEFVGVKFLFTLNYEPKIAKIELGGDIIVSLDPAIVRNIVKDWKEKKISEEFRIDLFNTILR
jgi:hypothetical protein